MTHILQFLFMEIINLSFMEIYCYYCFYNVISTALEEY